MLGLPFLVLLLYFFSLGRYHTTTYTATYEEHPLTNSPPFTFLGNAFVHSNRVFVTKLTLKPKFLKFNHSTSLRVFSPKCTQAVHSKFAEIFVQTPPKHCLKPSTIETQFGGFSSIIPINFSKKCQIHH